PESRPARVRPARLHHGGARCRRCVAEVCRRRRWWVPLRHARRGSGSHDPSSSCGLVGGLRRLGDRVHGGPRFAARPGEATLPMVVWNAAVRLETSRSLVSPRTRSTRLVCFSVRLALSAHLPCTVACSRSALCLESDFLLARSGATWHYLRAYESARAD